MVMTDEETVQHLVVVGDYACDKSLTTDSEYVDESNEKVCDEL